jgi:hypothetical protein
LAAQKRMTRGPEVDMAVDHVALTTTGALLRSRSQTVALADEIQSPGAVLMGLVVAASCQEDSVGT